MAQVASTADGQGFSAITDDAVKRSHDLESIRNKVIVGDALEIMPGLPDESFDMIFVDPPYFLQLPRKTLRRWNANTQVNAVTDQWDRFASFEDYDAFIESVLSQTRRLLKPTGTIWVISTYHSIFRIGNIMQDLGYWILNDVIWLKTNPMPNWLGVRFTNATETLIWAVRDKTAKGYAFDKAVAKDVGLGKVGANVWVIPLCTGRERIKTSNGEKLHSTQKPIELLRRIILTTTRENDLVLDPMAGTGTTGYVAKSLGRDFVMIEKDPSYVEGFLERANAPLKTIPPACRNEAYPDLPEGLA